MLHFILSVCVVLHHKCTVTSMVASMRLFKIHLLTDHFLKSNIYLHESLCYNGWLRREAEIWARPFSFMYLQVMQLFYWGKEITHCGITQTFFLTTLRLRWYNKPNDCIYNFLCDCYTNVVYHIHSLKEMKHKAGSSNVKAHSLMQD